MTTPSTELSHGGCLTPLDVSQQCWNLVRSAWTSFQRRDPASSKSSFWICACLRWRFTVATEIINKYGRTKRLVISALIANSNTKTRQRCFEVGMDYVLMKPINLEHLRSELSKLVDFHEELNFQHEFDTPPQLVSQRMKLDQVKKRLSTTSHLNKEVRLWTKPDHQATNYLRSLLHLNYNCPLVESCTTITTKKVIPNRGAACSRFRLFFFCFAKF